MYVNDRNDPNDYGQGSSCIGSPLIINAVRIPQDAERVIDADEEVWLVAYRTDYMAYSEPTRSSYCIPSCRLSR